jgi:hypothetical protein
VSDSQVPTPLADSEKLAADAVRCQIRILKIFGVVLKIGNTGGEGTSVSAGQLPRDMELGAGVGCRRRGSLPAPVPVRSS